MNWRIVSASVTGTAHRTAGAACQDSCWAQVDSAPGRPDTLSLFVADGAGSAAYGGEGAELAIQAAADFLAAKIACPEFALDDTLAVDCVSAVRAHLNAYASSRGHGVRDYACTFLGVLCSSQATLLMQIGDGAIVIDIGNGLEVPVAPMTGEYANMTRFVTDEDALEHLAHRFFTKPATRIAACTDGLQRLALNLFANTPHEPFFTPFFAALAKATPEQADSLHAALADFLDTAPVNERTDDDKTLALAVSTA